MPVVFTRHGLASTVFDNKCADMGADAHQCTDSLLHASKLHHVSDTRKTMGIASGWPARRRRFDATINRLTETAAMTQDMALTI
jgi:hypothetical protein